MNPARPFFLVLSFLLAGCASSPNPEADARETYAFRPITRNALVEVITPSPPHDRTPACQILDMNEPATILNLTATAVWSPNAERTRNLLLRLDPPGTAADTSRTGKPPLNATSPSFDAASGDRIRVILGLVGSEPADVLLSGQQATLVIAFVVRTPGNETGPLQARWDSQTKCPD